MESTMESVTAMDIERVEQSNDKEIEIGERNQDIGKQMENKNPGETVGEEAFVRENKDSACPMVIEEGTSLASSTVMPTVEKGTNDDDPSKVDFGKTHDKNNSQLETNPHLRPSPSVASDPEGLIQHTAEDIVEQNIGSTEVSSDIFNNDGDIVMVEEDTAVVHEEMTEIPDTKLSEGEGLPQHYTNTVMEQEKAAEGHEMISSGDHNEFAVNPDTKISKEIESPHHHANNVMEQKDSAEEHDMVSSGDHNEFPVNPDVKPSEEIESPHQLANTVMEQDKATEEEHGIISSGDCKEFPANPDTKLSEDIESPHHHANTVMEQEKIAEEHDMISSGDHNEFPVNPDTKLSEDIESPHHLANTVMEQDKAAEEEHGIISSGDCKEFPANPDTKVIEEKNDNGGGSIYDDQGITEELDNGPVVPGSETVLKLEDKPSEPLIETSMTVEKEPDMPATEILTENDKKSDVLAVGVSGDSDNGLYVLPGTQNNEGMNTLEAESTDDMKPDVPDSKLVADTTFDSTSNKDVIIEEAATNSEKIGNCSVTERMEADIENVSVRHEPSPLCVASSNIKSEVGISGDLNNGINKIDMAPPAFDGAISTKRSFLLDDTSDGNESGTEEDQSAFMEELYRFYTEKNMEFKPPKFYGEGLNCLKLWRAVIRLGGHEKVTGSKLWKQVGESFRPPKTCTTVSWTFRGFYEKALLEYERHKISEGELHIPLASEQVPMNIDNQVSGLGRVKRDAAARAMQGWHSQRLNGNGEVSDAAIKDKSVVLHQKREKQIGTTPGSRKRKMSSDEHGARTAVQMSRPTSDATVIDIGQPADWVKINVQRTQDCFEVYALVPGLVREEIRVQSDPAGRLVITGEPENPMNPWGVTPFKKVVNLPTRIDPHHTSAVVTLNGQLFVRVPIEQSD